MTCYNFAVHERPCAAWSLELEEENTAFLENIDPSVFTAGVEGQLPQLENESTRLTSALAIRLVYGHALETFFALIGATVQAPHCPLAWILAYRNEELQSVVDDISNGRVRYARVPTPVTWESLSDRIHHRFPVEAESAKREFSKAWRRLAHEFTDELKVAEYNSIKHGLRVQSGGFSLRVGTSTLAAPIIDSTSVFGTRFHLRNRLDLHNFSIAQAAVNWNPTALAVRTELIYMSINNVVNFLREITATKEITIRPLWPAGPENAWELPWQADYKVEQMSGGRVLQTEDVTLRSAADILSTYD